LRSAVADVAKPHGLDGCLCSFSEYCAVVKPHGLDGCNIRGPAVWRDGHIPVVAAALHNVPVRAS